MIEYDNITSYDYILYNDDGAVSWVYIVSSLKVNTLSMNTDTSSGLNLHALLYVQLDPVAQIVGPLYPVPCKGCPCQTSEQVNCTTRTATLSIYRLSCSRVTCRRRRGHGS